MLVTIVFISIYLLCPPVIAIRNPKALRLERLLF